MSSAARPSAAAIASRLAAAPASLGIAGMMKLERPWSLPSGTTRHFTRPIFSSSTTSLPAPRRNVSTSAVPTVGWPANGISLPGVKMRAPAVLPAALGLSTNTVSGWLNSRATTCMVALSMPSASNTTPSELPAKRLVVKTSSVAKFSFIVLIRSLLRHVALGRFVHQSQGVTIGVAEKRHPQIVIVHLRDQMWRTVEGKATLHEFGDCYGNVRAAKIDAAPLGADHIVGLFKQ